MVKSNNAKKFSLLRQKYPFFVYTAKLGEVETENAVLGGTQRLRDALGSLQFSAVTLAVIEGQAVAVESLAARNGEAGGGVETAGKENHGACIHGARIYPNLPVDRAGICLFLSYNLQF